jgi:hypothetical protein
MNTDRTIKLNDTKEENIESLLQKGKNKKSKSSQTKSSFYLDNNIIKEYSDKKQKKIYNYPIIRNKNGFLFNNLLCRNAENNSFISNINNTLQNISSNNEDFKNTIKKIKKNRNRRNVKFCENSIRKTNVIIIYINNIKNRMKFLKN